MTIEAEKDVIGLMKIGKIVGLALRTMQDQLRPGMTTQALDRIGETFLTRHGARSAPVITYQFPGATCISINDEAAHGIPGHRVIEEAIWSRSTCRRSWTATLPMPTSPWRWARSPLQNRRW